MPNVTITDITIEAEIDQDPPLDYLGEYRSQPGPEDRTVDRAARGDQGRGEHRYFIAPEWVENPEHVEQNYQRAESYGVHWWSLGIHAVAHIDVGGRHVGTVKSGGLWGVGSDSGEEHLESVARDELADLYRILADMGLDVPDSIEPTWSGDAAPASGPVVA